MQRVASSHADELSDTDDESGATAPTAATDDAFTSAETFDADVDADAQMAALDEHMGAAAAVPRSVRLTLALVRENVRDAAELGHGADVADAEIDALLRKKTLRLDWLDIGRIENLDAFTHVQELYLQHNQLRAIENLEHLQRLTFLALADNRIERVEGLRDLTSLKFLDLSNNCIEDFDIREFPESLMIIRLAGNPFIRHMPSYVHLFFERLPNVVQVDHFRRAPPQATADCSSSSDAASAKSPPSTAAVYSPRMRYVELEMEVELNQDLLALPSATTAKRSGGDTEAAEVLLEEFDLASYEEQRRQRMRKWSEQLKGLETRKAEVGDRPLPTAATTMHAKALDRARAGTKAAIAESISHFEQMELEHKEWQENQQQQQHHHQHQQ
ncbi:hypothetical protein PybrP1_007031 [[Pythium] brassicae (nom. inval.)]|nr:hypothetical protein PybrP1_007031 [[Pythium] brassicae (nom. inval.)]